MMEKGKNKMNNRTYIDVRELLNPKLFQPLNEEPEAAIPDKHLLNGKLTMTVREMAEQLNISEAKAYEMTETAGFPVLRVGPRRKVIPVEMFLEWMRTQTKGVS